MHGPLTLALALTLVSAAPRADEERPEPQEPAAKTAWEYLADKYDKNDDGEITRKEYGGPKDRWEQLDKDGNGRIDEAEIEARGRVDRAKPGKKRGQAPKVGRRAPGFELLVLEDVHELPVEPDEGDKDEDGAKKGGDDGKKGDEGSKEAPAPEEPRTIALADFRGKQPVALIFGSYT